MRFSAFFPDIAQQFNTHNWLSEKAIFAAKNKGVDDLNEHSEFASGSVVFVHTSYRVTNQDDFNGFAWTPTSQFTINLGSGLCNGTRLAV